MHDTVVGLQRGHVLLHLDLFILVLLNVVAYFFAEVQVDFANFLQVQVFGNHDVKPKVEGKQKENWLNGDQGKKVSDIDQLSPDP